MSESLMLARSTMNTAKCMFMVEGRVREGVRFRQGRGSIYTTKEEVRLLRLALRSVS